MIYDIDSKRYQRSFINIAVYKNVRYIYITSMNQ